MLGQIQRLQVILSPCHHSNAPFPQVEWHRKQSARNTLWQVTGKGEMAEGERISLCQSVVIEYLTHSAVLTFVAVHKCFDQNSISNASDFGCGKVTLQGRKQCLFKGENFTFWPNWLCIASGSAGHVNIKKSLMKPWGMTVSKVHIIYGEVTVGKRPAIRLHCFWWPESHEWSLEFFGQSFVFEPKPSWQPLPHCVISLHIYTHMDVYTLLHTSEHAIPHSHTHCHPSSVAWSSCNVPKSTSCILGRWERTSWKQWKGLICGFASGFDKGPCSKPKFLWPLVKNFSSPPAHPSYSCSFCE